MLTFRSDALSMKVIACRPIAPTERIPADPSASRRRHRVAFPGSPSWLTRGPPGAGIPVPRTSISASQGGIHYVDARVRFAFRFER
jgi:hypothetical protein